MYCIPSLQKKLSTSRQHCERLFADLVGERRIREKAQEAVRRSNPLSNQSEITVVSGMYNRRAVGPAARDVLERGLTDLNKVSDILKTIPGAPRNMKVLGIGSVRVKLSWEPPLHNPEAVEEYVVYTNEGDGDWKEAVTTQKTKVLLKGLVSNTTHEFRVVATNSVMTGLTITKETATKLSAANGAALLASATSPAMPLLMLTGITKLPFHRKTPELTNSTRGLLVGTSVVIIPLFLFLAPLMIPAAPIAAVVGAVAAVGSKTGDLTEE